MTDGCMAFMGKPLSEEVRQVAYEHAKAMGLSTGDAYDCIQQMSAQYEQDQPYEAQKRSLHFVDLIGHYRLMAALSAAWWAEVGQYESTKGEDRKDE